MRTIALLWFCGFLAIVIAIAQPGKVQVEEIVNDVIKPNNGLFSDVVEQFGIVSSSPTPSATTSVTPTTSPSASVNPSISPSSSPLVSGSALPSLTPSPSQLRSASPSSSKSPMPLPEGRRPSSPDASEPRASPAAALVTPSASSSSTPSPSPSCTVQVENVGGFGGSGGSLYSDLTRVASAGTLTGIAVRAGGTGFRFETSADVLRGGETDSNDPFLAVPPGETVQTAVACKDTDINYLLFGLSNGQSIASGAQPASECRMVTAPPGGEILGSIGLVLPDGTLRALQFFGRTLVC